MNRRLFNALSAVSLLLCLASLYGINSNLHWRVAWGHQHPRVLRESGDFITFERRDPPNDWHINLNATCGGSMILPSLWCACWFREYRERKALKLRGLCVCCGYDLRATPIRCPECGTVPKIQLPINDS